MKTNLNDEYVKILKQMRELNELRANIFKEFKIENTDAKTRNMMTVSLYHDLYDNDIDV